MQDHSRVSSAPADELRQCPRCGEYIMRVAKVCRFCGFDLSRVLAAEEDMRGRVIDLGGVTMKEVSDGTRSPSQRITDLIATLGDWRGEMLAQLREVILEADPAATEDWKWNTPVWSHDGLVCAAAAFKDHLKLNFFQGAALEDRDRLFNAGLDAKVTRAIDFHEGDVVDRAALRRLVSEAVAFNSGAAK